MRRLLVVGVLAHALALGALAVAFLKLDQYGTEGAFFDRAEGSDVVVFSPAPPKLWLIAAAVLLVVGTICLVVAVRTRMTDRRPSGPVR